MSQEGTNHGNEGTVEREPCLVLTVTMNTRTAQVTFACPDMPIALAQMIVGEVARQLEEQRRLAVAQQLQQRALEQQRTQEILAKVARDRAGN